MQRSDIKLGKIIEILEASLDDSEYSQYFQIHQGILFKKVEGGEQDWRLVVPDGLVDTVVWECHISYGHFGARKCVNVLKESCLFKNMERRVRKLLWGCDLCQKATVVNYRLEGELNFIKVERPFDLVTVDLFGLLLKGRGGVIYVFVVLDTFSKFVKLYSVKRATSKILSEKITRDYMVNVGKPKVILSDHGPQFISSKWRQTLGWEGIIPKHTAVYHPQSLSLIHI